MTETKVEVYQEKDGTETVIEVWTRQVTDRPGNGGEYSWATEENPQYEAQKQQAMQEGAKFLREETLTSQ